MRAWLPQPILKACGHECPWECSVGTSCSTAPGEEAHTDGPCHSPKHTFPPSTVGDVRKPNHIWVN
eukprot:4145271-Amphidinium_carterae.2